jgi:hypothetical protein
MPFDLSPGHVTFLSVSNLSGRSPAAAAVQTHWVFWSESCDHLVDLWICLTLNDTVVVDPSRASSIDIDNRAVGPVVDLSGRRGMVTVTAYETDEECRSLGTLPPVDGAIVGMFTLANVATGAAFGHDALGLGLDASGSHTELPDALLSPSASEGFLDIQTFNPSSLQDSTVVLLAVQEGAGQGASASVEIGPLRGVTANLSFSDSLEVQTSLPDVAISCAQFVNLEPEAVTFTSAGVFRLTNILVDGGAVGRTTWVYGFTGYAVGPFGAASSARYLFQPAAPRTLASNPTSGTRWPLRFR